MSEKVSFFQRRLVSGESLIEVVENLKLGLAFVPLGQPTVNAAPNILGSLALTSHRLIVQWTDARLKAYSTFGVYGLSERFFIKGTTWPYQATLILPGGMSLVVETISRDTQSAEQLSGFLTNTLFALGKRHDDFASIAAINAYLEELRRQEEQRRQHDD